MAAKVPGHQLRPRPLVTKRNCFAIVERQAGGIQMPARVRLKGFIDGLRTHLSRST